MFFDVNRHRDFHRLLHDDLFEHGNLNRHRNGLGDVDHLVHRNRDVLVDLERDDSDLSVGTIRTIVRNSEAGVLKFLPDHFRSTIFCPKSRRRPACENFRNELAFVEICEY